MICYLSLDLGSPPKMLSVLFMQLLDLCFLYPALPTLYTFNYPLLTCDDPFCLLCCPCTYFVIYPFLPSTYALYENCCYWIMCCNSALFWMCLWSCSSWSFLLGISSASSFALICLNFSLSSLSTTFKWMRWLPEGLPLLVAVMLLLCEWSTVVSAPVRKA